MSLPTVQARLRPVQYDGTYESAPNYRVPFRIRYDLILSKNALPFESVGYNEYACSQVGHIEPKASQLRRVSNGGGSGTDQYLVPTSGYFQTEPQATGGSTYEGFVILVKNQVLDPNSYYLVTWQYFPANAQANYLYYYQETPRMDNEAVAIAGGFGSTKKITKHSIPSSASGLIDLAAYRIA